MDLKAGKALEKIAAESLEKCVARLTRVSTAEWNVADSVVSWRSRAEAVKEHEESGSEEGAAAYFDVAGKHKFASLVVFRPSDIGLLSKGFLGFSFSRLSGLSQAQELLLSELGNIIVNSLVSSVSAALGSTFIPSVPKCVRGEIPFLLEALWASSDSAGKHTLVTVILNLRCCDNVARVEVITLIPEDMEAALAALPGAGD